MKYARSIVEAVGWTTLLLIILGAVSFKTKDGIYRFSAFTKERPQ